MAEPRRTPHRHRSTRVIIGIVVGVAILYTFLGLGSHLLGQRSPDTNYGGILGHWLARALVAVLGWAGLLVPLLGAAAGVTALRRAPGRWRSFSGMVLAGLGLVVAAGLLSYHVGAATAGTNPCGWSGAVAGGLLSRFLGFGAYALPALAILWGLAFWFGRAIRPWFIHTAFVLLLGLFLELFLGVFARQATWRPLPTGAFTFPLAGSVGNGAADGLRQLLGGAGTVIVLIAAFVIFVLAFIAVPLPAPGAPVSLLKRLLLLLRRRPSAAPVGAPVRSAGPVLPSGAEPFTPSAPRAPAGAPAREEPAPGRTGAPAPADGGTVPAGEPEPGEPDETAEPERPRPPPRRKPVAGFDLNRFQATFLDQLDRPGPGDQYFKDPRESGQEAERLLDKLHQFDVEGEVTNIVSGPLVTRFEFEPAPGIKINRIENLADDLSLALSAESIRILAPIPGRNAVGIEIPNRERRIVHLRDVLTSDAFRAEPPPLGFALGTTITGEPCCADLRTMPHILIAGTTGSGKSVCINSIICSIIYRSSYHDDRFLTIDPKQLELPLYNSIPHLMGRTRTNPKEALKELSRVVKIMDTRIGEFAELGVRDIAGYNQRARAEGLEPKPYIVIIIDELADLMLRAANEIEERITRLAQMSRAVGIHLILATQRPSVDVITGLIKANFPCRIAFQVASKTDSRTILDMNGAEALLGRGDMLFLPPGKGEPIRLHGTFVSDAAVRRVVDLWTTAYLSELLGGKVDKPVEKARELVERDVVDIFYDPRKAGIKKKRQDLCDILPEEVADDLLSRDYYEPLPEVRSGAMEEQVRRESHEAREIDEKFAEAARIVVRHKEASVSMLQRRLDVGWARAGRIIDQLEEAGVVGPYVGSKSRKVVVESETALEQLLAGMKTGDQQAGADG